MLRLPSMLAAGAVATAAVFGGCSRHRSSPAGGPPPAAVTSSPAGDPTSKTPKVQPSAEAQALSDAFAEAARAIRPSVVRLDVESPDRELGAIDESGGGERGGEEPDLPDFLRHFFQFRGTPPPTPTPTRGTGSGVIIDGNGDILTNSHVIREAEKVTIRLADGRSFRGKVVGTDPLTDVGVIKLEKPPKDLVVARLGESDKLRAGEWVIAVGSPLGMDQTVTAGIVSGVGETGAHFRFESGERVRKYIQTDAKINPGNSGGPLVNLRAEVIGINTLINVGPGGSYGFAIPIKQASDVAAVLVKGGHIRYPYIGVSVVSMADAPKELLAKIGPGLPKEGALVAAVAEAGPAAVAGVLPGDVITKIGGRAVKTANDVVDALSQAHVGANVALGYVRGGKAREQSVKVGDFPSEHTREDGQHRLGVALQTLTEQLARTLGLDPTTKGAVIVEVEPGSPAEAAGLEAGDVIREIDKKPVASSEDAVAAMQVAKGAHLLRITNAAGTRFVTVKPAG
jgi:serine protease Do